MGIYRVSEQAEAELDGIWLYIAQDTSIDIANHLIDSITARFWMLAAHPYIGRARNADLGQGLRSFRQEITPSFTKSTSSPRKKKCMFCALSIHGVI